MLAITVESPLSPDGLALIAGSQAALLDVFAPDEIFTLDPSELAVPAITFFVARDTGRAIGCVALADCGDYGEIKRLVYAGADQTFAAQLDAEKEAFARCAGTRDFAEGVTAFVEKRKPDFKGN